MEHRRFITAFTTARHLSPQPDQSSPQLPIPPLKDPFQYYLAIYSWVLQMVYFLRFPHQIPVSTSPLLHTCYIHRLWQSSWFVIWCGQIIKLLIMYSSPLPCQPVPLRPIYLPHRPILKHPQSIFLPQWNRPCFTPIQNHRQNYNSVYLNFYILG
jgi:hypothetical protein